MPLTILTLDIPRCVQLMPIGTYQDKEIPPVLSPFFVLHQMRHKIMSIKNQHIPCQAKMQRDKINRKITEKQLDRQTHR